jgi:hypothetical protein
MLANTFSIYLKSTSKFGIYYREGESSKLKEYTDEDLAGDTENRKSTSGYIFQLGSELITWSSRKQPTTALFSTEAKYRSLIEGAKGAAWLKLLLCSMGQSKDKFVLIHCDNHSCMKIAKSHVYKVRTKHIKVHYHYIRELQKNFKVNLNSFMLPQNTSLADVLTKPLGKIKFCKFRRAIGVYSLEDAEVLVGVGDLPIK